MISGGAAIKEKKTVKHILHLLVLSAENLCTWAELGVWVCGWVGGWGGAGDPDHPLKITKI